MKKTLLLIFVLSMIILLVALPISGGCRIEEEVTYEPEEQEKKALDEPEAESPNVEETTKESKIYFSSDRDSQYGDMELYIMNLDGSEQTKIEGVLEPNYDPYFTPDGSKCISFSECGDNREIYLSDINGTGEVNLTNNPADDWGASFSPDGLKIVFLSNRDGNLEIYIMNVDGSEQTRLTDNPADEYAPCFSLDASKIAFNSYRDGNSEIYIMNTDGSDQINLTNNPADDYILFFTTMY